MKVPPKRKGNILAVIANAANTRSLNESPSEKEGKYRPKPAAKKISTFASMKVPPKRKGNIFVTRRCKAGVIASMKVPPKRKGNGDHPLTRFILEHRPQ